MLSPAIAGRRRSPFVSVLCLVLGSLVHVACSSSGEEPASSPSLESPSESPSPVETTDPEPVNDPQRQACDAETAKLQAGIDAAHKKITGVVLAVKNPPCGLRILTSGGKDLDPTKLQRIGSITKTYVAAVILSLVSEGAIALDDPLSKWVSTVPNGENISIRQLLQHESGLFNYTDDTDFLTQALTTDTSYTPQQLVDVSIAHPVYGPPGSEWHYSNTNFVLLGMIAESVGKKPIAALVRERVLTKLGANETFFDGEEAVHGTLATGLSSTNADLTHAYGLSWAWAAGAMVATPSDLVLWIERLGNGSFYDAATQSEVVTTVPTSQASMGYGLGMMVLSNAATGGAGAGYGHGGDIPGYHSQAFYFPDSKTTIASISDSDAVSPNDITIVALSVLFGGQ